MANMWKKKLGILSVFRRRKRVVRKSEIEQVRRYLNESVCFGFHGPLAFEPCVGDHSPPAHAVPDPAKCYPLDLGAVIDLDQAHGHR